jgi:hypothetical protein
VILEFEIEEGEIVEVFYERLAGVADDLAVVLEPEAGGAARVAAFVDGVDSLQEAAVASPIQMASAPGQLLRDGWWGGCRPTMGRRALGRRLVTWVTCSAMGPDAEADDVAVLADFEKLLVEGLGEILIVVMGGEALAGLAPEIGGAEEDQIDAKAVALELRGNAAGADAVDVIGEADQADGSRHGPG